MRRYTDETNTNTLEVESCGFMATIIKRRTGLSETKGFFETFNKNYDQLGHRLGIDKEILIGKCTEFRLKLKIGTRPRSHEIVMGIIQKAEPFTGVIVSITIRTLIVSNGIHLGSSL